MQILTRGSTNVIRVLEYTDEVTELAAIDATVTGTLYDQSGAAVTGATNLAMPYYAASGAIAAQYRGIVPSTVLLPNETYDLRVTATNANGTRLFNDTCVVEDG
jgi:hypothetical protein